jgi:hypothetical protein
MGEMFDACRVTAENGFLVVVRLRSCPTAMKVLLLLSRIICKALQAVNLRNMASLLRTYVT